LKPGLSRAVRVRGCGFYVMEVSLPGARDLR
jgi:hypothetical protein